MKDVLKHQRIARRRVGELRSARLGIHAIRNMRLPFGLFVLISTVTSLFGAVAAVVDTTTRAS